MYAALYYNPALYLPISIAECVLISEGVYLEIKAWAVCIPDRRLKKKKGDLFVEVCISVQQCWAHTWLLI